MVPFDRVIIFKGEKLKIREIADEICRGVTLEDLLIGIKKLQEIASSIEQDVSGKGQEVKDRYEQNG